MSLSERDIAGVVHATLDELGSNQGFTYSAPRVTLSGPGSVARLGQVLANMGFTSTYIVADAEVSKLGLVDGLLRTCRRHHISTRLFDQINAEPCMDLVLRLIADYRQQPANVVIGIGGGSALDAAKALAVLANDEHTTIAELAQGNVPWRRDVGLVCVPTTAGTGSEATNVTVIMEPDHSAKYIITGQSLMPDVAVLDASLMEGLPARVTAATGIDALTHAIEAYVARGANPLSKALAYWAVQSLVSGLPQAVGNGTNSKVRDELALAAYKAGVAFSNAGLGLVHAMSHAAGARYGIPHGIANALLLTAVMRFNMLVCVDAFAELATAMHIPTERLTPRQRATAAIDAIDTLLSDIDLQVSLSDYQASPRDFPALAEQVLEDVCCASNPRQVTAPDIIRLYQQVLGAR